MDKQISKLNTQKEKKPLNDKTLEVQKTIANEISPKEQGGPKGPEPTRYGDWEKSGRCSDFQPNFFKMNELKAEIIINAGIRAAERNFANAYVIKRGDSEAGAIFIKIDTLDGYAKLYSRNLVYDFDKNEDLVQFQD